MEGRVGIIIAHKLWTLNHVDDILVLENGQVLEQGSRLDLMSDETSQYFKLVEMSIGKELIS